MVYDPSAGALPLERIEVYLRKLHEDWEIEGNLLKRTFVFSSYQRGVDFLNKIAAIAEEMNHHPDMLLGWKKVTVALTTHAVNGLSEGDFVLAEKIDKLDL